MNRPQPDVTEVFENKKSKIDVFTQLFIDRTEQRKRTIASNVKTKDPTLGHHG